MFRDLVGIFRFKSKIGGFNRFAVFAAYFDESATGSTRRGIVAVAASIATADAWSAFDDAWRPVVEDSGLQRAFHAMENDPVQRRLNGTLPGIMNSAGVFSVCVVFDRAAHIRITSPEDRSVFGNDHGFAWLACASVVSGALEQNGEYAGYYIDQGGLGSKKAMQFLSGAYRDDEARESWRLADYGPADRRIHLPLHPADLVAHELATVGRSSAVIKSLNDVNVVDLDEHQLKSIADALSALWLRIKVERNRERFARRANRRSTDHG